MKLDWLNRYNLLLFETVDSTNSEGLRLAKAGPIGDFVIISNIQTGGRGTNSKDWFSASGNLHASILLQTNYTPQQCLQLSFLASYSLYEAINYIAQTQDITLPLKLKWPNDLLIKNSKVAGILLESIKINDTRYLVIGFGVNIIDKPNIKIKTAHLQEYGVKIANTDFLLNILMSKFETNYRFWQRKRNFSELKQKWLDNAFKFKEKLTIRTNNKSVAGIFEDININGEIILLLKNQLYQKILHGSITATELQNEKYP